jgi:hypothetical protein
MSGGAARGGGIGPDVLSRLVLDAFAGLPPVPPDRIVAHHCDECVALRDARAGQPQPLDDATAEAVRWGLPLLSDEGKQYFLPAWLLRSIADVHTDFTDSLLFALDGDHRWQPPGAYSAAQREAIRAYLAYLLHRVDELGTLEPQLARAIERWA